MFSTAAEGTLSRVCTARQPVENDAGADLGVFLTAPPSPQQKTLKSKWILLIAIVRYPVSYQTARFPQSKLQG